MIGARISNILWRAAPLIPACAFAASAADEVVLTDGGSRLSGTVRALGPDGVVELATPLTPEPLLLNGSSVGKITFSHQASAADPPPMLVELANGDLLPATVENLGSRHLTVISPVAGRLEIPREHVKTLQLGIRRGRLVYQGPRNPGEWSSANPEDHGNWTFERGAMVSQGPAAASRMFDLPRRFALRFTLVWQNAQIPNFQVFFADPLAPGSAACDRYYLQFGGAGMEIKRESATGKRYHTIAILDRTPDQYPDRLVRVEILVNRDTARLALALNGEPEGEFADPIAGIPDGGGITLASNTPKGSMQEIRNIEITEHDDSDRRHRAEERGDPGSDSLISREDDRFTGRLIEIRGNGSGLVFMFKTDFQQQPVAIPGADVSTVFFSGPGPAAPRAATQPFVLRLQGNGSLGVSSCLFAGESAQAGHPLLGTLTLRRDGLSAIERPPAATGNAPEP